MPNPLYDALFAPLNTRTSPLLILADGAQISGAEFHTTIARAANALRAAGVQVGDRVAVQIAKSPQALAIYAATVSIGAVFLPLNPAYTPPEVGYFLSDATPRLFICDPAKAEALGAVASQTTLKTLDAKGGGSFGADMAQADPQFAPQARLGADLAAILYTSGTIPGRDVDAGEPLVQRTDLGRSVALYPARRAAARFADLSHPRVIRRLKRQFADGGADDLPVGV